MADLESKSIYRVIDVLSEGPCGGLVDGAKSIMFNGVQLQADSGEYNFEGVTYEIRNGTEDQDWISGFPSVETTVSVGVEVEQPTPVTRTIHDPMVDAVRITIALAALMKVDKDNGHRHGTKIDFSIEFVGYTTHYVTLNGKATTTYEKSYYFKLPERTTPLDIKLTRITADSESSSLINAFNWQSYTELIEHKLAYPGTCLIALTFDAKLFGGSIPSRRYHLLGKMIAVPSNYDPVTRVYTGIWDGTFQYVNGCSNPAWCYYDLQSNAVYGGGLPVVDKWALYTIGQRCDELVPDGNGGFEPRFTLNVGINQAYPAYSLINTMASVFMGMPLWSAGAVSAFQDAPEDYSMLVTPANVIDGVFSYEGTSRKARKTVAYISWADPDNIGEMTIEPVVNRDAVVKYGYIEIEETAFGCTSQGEAQRKGKWITYSGDAEKQTVTYKAGMDHAMLGLGRIIAVADPDVSGTRRQGRLLPGSTVDVLLLDNCDELNSEETYSIMVMLPDGTVEERPIVWPGTPVNLFLSSSDLTASAWTKAACTIGANTGPAIGPLAASVADKIIPDGSSSTSHGVSQVYSSFIFGKSYVISCFVTPGGYAYVSLSTPVGLFSDVIEVLFDLNLQGKSLISGAPTDYGIIPVAGGYRIFIVATAAASGSFPACYLNVLPSVGGSETWVDDASVLFTDDFGGTWAVEGVTLATAGDGVSGVYAGGFLLQEDATSVAPLEVTGQSLVVELETPLSQPPAANAVWVITGSDVEPRLFRVISKTEPEPGEYQIIAVEHDPTKYALIEQGIVVERPPYVLPVDSGPILPPSNLQATLASFYSDGILKAMIEFAWSASPDSRVGYYETQYKINDGNWTDIAPTSAFLVEKTDVETGTYYFRVRAVSRTGSESVWAETSLEVDENTMPNVTGLALVGGSSATEFVGGDATFTWNATALSDIPAPGGTDPWFKQYIIEIYKSSVLVRTEASQVNSYVYTKAKNVLDGTVSRAFTIKVYQQGNLGQLSATPAELTVSNPAPTMAGFLPTVTETFKGLKLDWSNWVTSDPDIEFIKIYIDNDNPPVQFIEQVVATLNGYTEIGLTTGTVYYVKLVPVDAFGDGTPSSVGAGTPAVLTGVDVEVELSGSWAITDSAGTSGATLAKLYDRNVLTDGVTFTVSGVDKWIQYYSKLEDYIDKVIIHTADANGRVYVALSTDGTTWGWYSAGVSHNLTGEGELVSVAAQATAVTQYWQLAAGLNVAVLPQRTTARYCRLYITGTYSTVIYELVFVREVIAEQVVADNLSAISANLGSIETGLLQSSTYSTTNGVYIDLDNSELHLGGSEGGTVSEGLTYDPTNGVGLLSRNAETGDSVVLSNAGLTFYFSDGISTFPYKAVQKVVPGTANSGVPFTVPGYWRSAPTILPTFSNVMTYSSVYPTNSQRLVMSVSDLVETTTGKWETTIDAELVVDSGSDVILWDPADSEITATVTTYLPTLQTVSATSDTVVTPAGTVEITASCALEWYHNRVRPGSLATVEVTLYYGLVDPPTATQQVFQTQTLILVNTYTATYNFNPSVTFTVPAGAYYCYFKLTVGAMEDGSSSVTSTATVGGMSLYVVTGGADVLAVGQVQYIAFGND